MTTEGLDTGQLIAALNTLENVARFMKANENDADIKRFYNYFAVYCLIIRRERVGLQRLVRLLDQLESKITFDVQRAIPDTLHQPLSGFRLVALTRWWERAQKQKDDVLKAELVRTCLSFGSAADARHELLQILADFEEEIRSRDSQGTSEWTADDFASQKRIDEPPYAVWRASQSLYKALFYCKQCSCTIVHNFDAQLCLGTYRTPPQASQHQDDRNIDFDMFLSLEQTPEWQEVCVHTTKETTVHFAETDETSYLGTQRRRENSRQIKVRRLCEPIKKARSMQEDRLEFKVARDRLFSMLTDKRTSLIDTSKDPVSLEQFLEAGPISFTERTRRILAVILSSAVLHFHDTPWLRSTWTSANIVFFRTRNKEMPLKPYIRSSLIESPEFVSNERHPENTEADDDLDDLLTHQCPILITLAIILLEVYFACPINILARRYGENWGDENASSHSRYIQLDQIFQACSVEIPENSRFHYALDKCLDSEIWEDENGERLDSSTLRSKIYKEVVQPLETELTQAYGSIDINDLDAFAGRLNFANWDQVIQPRHQQKPTDRPQDLFETPGQTHQHGVEQLSQGFQPTGIGGHTIGVAQTTGNGVSYESFRFFDDETISEAHNSKSSYSEWRDRHTKVYEKFVLSQRPNHHIQPVKIAVLDTGIDFTHPDVVARSEFFKEKRNWYDAERPEVVLDCDGHGTFVACLLLDYARGAELYVAKISDHKPVSPSIIASAINHAVSVWQVDIISMSFGFSSCQHKDYPKLKDAIRNAHKRDTLLFAAASNDGGRLGRSFPARERDVIAVHATDASGTRSKFSPTAAADDLSFATIGEAVESAWPVNLCDERTNSTFVKHKSGTSYATPIVVGVAAFMLQYARVHLPEVAGKLKSLDKMRELLRKVSEKKDSYQLRDGYHLIELSLHPDSLFGKERDHINYIIKDIINT